ncbi:MAG: ATP-binding cassette domain-containing protein, partial [Myxococcota bacterium]|nr:ATP-binding cassette domain-containing protein [Myxococcota bacterium]
MSDLQHGTPILRIEGVRHAFGEAFQLAIEGFQIFPGERVTVTGPSGSGKGSFLLVCAGSVALNQGRLSAQGRPIISASSAAAWRLRSVGFIFQQAPLFPQLSLLDNILLPARLQGRQVEGDLVGQAQNLLARVRLDGFGARFPEGLSQGERQRVELCRALLLRPRLLLADEPTASLDRESAQIVMRLLFDSQKERNAALILVSHDPREQALCERRESMLQWARDGSGLPFKWDMQNPSSRILGGTQVVRDESVAGGVKRSDDEDEIERERTRLDHPREQNKRDGKTAERRASQERRRPLFGKTAVAFALLSLRHYWGRTLLLTITLGLLTALPLTLSQF